MAIFNIQDKKLIKIKSKNFSEKELQNLIGNNLQQVFGFEFVAHEFNLESSYLDTLAFDPERNAFVIIEFKKRSSADLVAQGLTYLNLLLAHDRDVLDSYNERTDKNKKPSDIDWSQTRVTFISPSYTSYQKGALASSLPFELWQVTLLENYLLELNQLQPRSSSRSNQIHQVSRRRMPEIIKVYTVEEVLGKSPTEQREWMETLREKIMVLSTDMQEKAGQQSLSYKIMRSFVILWPHKETRKGLEIFFHQGAKLKDSQKLLQGSGKFSRSFYVKTEKDIEQAFEFIKQAYQRATDS